VNNSLYRIMKKYMEDNAENDVHSLLKESIFSVSTASKPIQPAKPRDDWEIERDPQRLVKTYSFPDSRGVINFVNELFEHQEEVGHHAKLTIERDRVTVEAYTHDVNDVTELDSEYARASDEIYYDVLSYNEEEVI